MSTRLLTLAAVLAIAAMACTSAPTADVEFGEGERLVQYVADSQDNVGLGASVAVNVDGLPTISYFGFPDKLEEGEIPAPRPIGAPFVPGVLLTSATAEGVFSRGAIETIEQLTPSGITPPFIPVQVPDLPLTPDNQNGTATVVDEDGTVHVAWTGPAGVSYGSVQYGGQAEVSLVYESDVTLSQAGPIGRPGITLDENGDPWVAFSVNSATGIDVIAARLDSEQWVIEKVADATRCNGCPGPSPTGIAVAGGAPTVVFADPGAGSVGAARLEGDTWTVSQVETGVSGAGLSVGSDAERIVAAYDSGGDAIHVATWDGSWAVAEAGPNASPKAADLTSFATDVSVGAETVYVTWEDDGEVRLVQGDGASFEPLEIGSPEGTQPSVASSEGAAYVAWYDGLSDDLMLGVWGEIEEIFLANPSPAPTQSVAPPSFEDCGDDGRLLLDIAAEGIAFETNCLVAPADEPFQIEFENLDAVDHNVAILTESGGEPLFNGEIFTGPASRAYDVEPLEAGEYYFQCDVHTQMAGALVAVEGAR